MGSNMPNRKELQNDYKLHVLRSKNLQQIKKRTIGVTQSLSPVNSEEPTSLSQQRAATSLILPPISDRPEW